MRIRRLLAAGVVAGSIVFALAPSASADPGKAAAKELRECVEKAVVSTEHTSGTELQNALEDCHKAKSIVVPAPGELLWGAVAFLIVAGVLMKFAFPMMKKTLAERQEKIRSEIEGAEKARADAEAEAAEYRRRLGDAHVESERIIEEARVSAEQVRTDLIARAEAEAAELKTRAGEDIRLAIDRAQSDLQSQVKDLSIELAEKVVGHNLDAETQRSLIDS